MQFLHSFGCNYNNYHTKSIHTLKRQFFQMFVSVVFQVVYMLGLFVVAAVESNHPKICYEMNKKKNLMTKDTKFGAGGGSKSLTLWAILRIIHSIDLFSTSNPIQERNPCDKAILDWINQYCYPFHYHSMLKHTIMMNHSLIAHVFP